MAHAHDARIFASASYDIVSVRQARQDAEAGQANCGGRSDNLQRLVRWGGCGTCWSKTLVGLGKIWKIELMSVSLHLSIACECATRDMKSITLQVSNTNKSHADKTLYNDKTKKT